MEATMLPLSRWEDLIPAGQYDRPVLRLVDPDGQSADHSSFRRVTKAIIEWLNQNPGKVDVTGDITSLYVISTKSGSKARFADISPHFRNGIQFYDPAVVLRLGIHIETKQDREILITGTLKLLEVCGVSPETFRICAVGGVGSGSAGDALAEDGWLSLVKWNDLNPYSKNASFRVKIRFPNGTIIERGRTSDAFRDLLQYAEENHVRIPEDGAIFIVKPETGESREFSRPSQSSISYVKPLRDPYHSPKLGITVNMDQRRSVLILGILEIFRRCGIDAETFHVRKVGEIQNPPTIPAVEHPSRQHSNLDLIPVQKPWSQLNLREIKDLLLEYQKSGDKIGCPGCGRRVEKEFTHIDHLNPRKSGGYDFITNRMVLCSHCNHTKSAHLTLSGLQLRNVETGWMENRKRAERIQKQVTERVKKLVEETS